MFQQEIRLDSCTLCGFLVEGIVANSETKTKAILPPRTSEARETYTAQKTDLDCITNNAQKTLSCDRGGDLAASGV